jgi:hypothetical protein
LQAGDCEEGRLLPKNAVDYNAVIPFKYKLFAMAWSRFSSMRRIERLRALLAHVDVVRLDHFRGFSAAWHVPAGAATAQSGHWVPGPGAEFFDAVRKELGTLPFIAEELGLITPDVRALRGAPIVQSLRQITHLPLEMHMMISDPDSRCKKANQTRPLLFARPSRKVTKWSGTIPLLTVPSLSLTQIP